MKQSSDRILTTHVGSLVRPPDLIAVLKAQESGQPSDAYWMACKLKKRSSPRWPTARLRRSGEMSITRPPGTTCLPLRTP